MSSALMTAYGMVPRHPAAERAGGDADADGMREDRPHASGPVHLVAKRREPQPPGPLSTLILLAAARTLR